MNKKKKTRNKYSRKIKKINNKSKKKLNKSKRSNIKYNDSKKLTGGASNEEKQGGEPAEATASSHNKETEWEREMESAKADLAEWRRRQEQRREQRQKKKQQWREEAATKVQSKLRQHQTKKKIKEMKVAKQEAAASSDNELKNYKKRNYFYTGNQESSELIQKIYLLRSQFHDLDREYENIRKKNGKKKQATINELELEQIKKDELERIKKEFDQAMKEIENGIKKKIIEEGEKEEFRISNNSPSSPNKENCETNDSNNSQPVKIKFGVGILLAGVVVTTALLLER